MSELARDAEVPVDAGKAPEPPRPFPQMPAELAIASAGRQLRLAAVVRVALLAAALAAVASGPLLARVWGDHASLFGYVLMFAVAFAWMKLALRAANAMRTVTGVPMLIGTGQHDLAEMRLAETLRTFTGERTTKVTALHHLALLRHAQGRFRESAALVTAAIDAARIRPAEPKVDLSGRLLLADAALHLGRLPVVYGALDTLRRQPMELDEGLQMLRLEIEYLARISAWPQLASELPLRVGLCELMPSESAALSQLLLGIAAERTGDSVAGDYLRHRAMLLCDIAALHGKRPWLAPLASDSHPS